MCVFDDNCLTQHCCFLFRNLFAITIIALILIIVISLQTHNILRQSMSLLSPSSWLTPANLSTMACNPKYNINNDNDTAEFPVPTSIWILKSSSSWDDCNTVAKKPETSNSKWSCNSHCQWWACLLNHCDALLLLHLNHQLECSIVLYNTNNYSPHAQRMTYYQRTTFFSCIPHLQLIMMQWSIRSICLPHWLLRSPRRTPGRNNNQRE